MPVPAFSITQISFIYECANQRLLNVTHWVNTMEVSLTPAGMSQNVADYVAAFTDPLTPTAKIISVLPDNVTLNAVRVQLIRDNRWAYKQALIGVAGEQSSTPTPNIDVAITKRTAIAGRDQVGGFYLPGVPTDQMEEGLLFPIFQADLFAAMDWLHTPMTWDVGEPDLVPVILHPLGAPEPYTTITDIVVQPEVRDMARRRVGRGE